MIQITGNELTLILSGLVLLALLVLSMQAERYIGALAEIDSITKGKTTCLRLGQLFVLRTIVVPVLVVLAFVCFYVAST